ncbi:hypothetical protein HK103_006625 [Boothiomyces macroporosus]|uniref:Uncharacterized protein n=1 Tax=Boothiomyces macroporosus TaxID=261099 RepID=A0AAD5Y1Z4_9FUNG|nr:hypothetical protein HK103_006625 [Boothiomyces macroporosus]
MARAGPTTLNEEPELPSAFGEIFSDAEKIQTKPKEEKKNDLQSMADTERLLNSIKYRKWKNHASRIKERTYDVNLTTTNMLPYDPLADEHLQDYFNSPHIRDHLLKLGLIDQEGNIVDEKRFKKNQIQLDKKAHEEKILGQQLERELDHDIEPGEGIPEHIVAKYPLSMQKTALIYTSSNPLHSTDAVLLNKLKDQPPSKLAALGTNKKQVEAKLKKLRERKSHTAPSSHHEKSMLVRDSSLVALFEQAKKEYQSGKLKNAEENLKALLKSVAAKSAPSTPKPDTDDEKKQNKKIPRSKRPKSARPTRNSAFPVSSAFSECDSEAEEEFEEDGILEDLESLDITTNVVQEVKEEPRPQTAKVDAGRSSRPPSGSQSRTQPEISGGDRLHKKSGSAQKKQTPPKPNPKPVSRSKEPSKSAQAPRIGLKNKTPEATHSSSVESQKVHPAKTIQEAPEQKQETVKDEAEKQTSVIEKESAYNDDFESSVAATLDDQPRDTQDVAQEQYQSLNNETRYEEDFSIAKSQSATSNEGPEASTLEHNNLNFKKNSVNNSLRNLDNNGSEIKSAKGSTSNLKKSNSNIALAARGSQPNLDLPRAPSVKFADEVPTQEIASSNKAIYQNDFEAENTNVEPDGQAEIHELPSSRKEKEMVDGYVEEFESELEAQQPEVVESENFESTVSSERIETNQTTTNTVNDSVKNSRPASARNSSAHLKNNVKSNSQSSTNLDKVSGAKSGHASHSNLKNFNSLNELDIAKKTKIPDSAPLSRNASADKLKGNSEKSYSSAADLIKAQKVAIPPSAPISRAASNSAVSRPKSETNLTSRSSSKAKGLEMVDRVTKKESVTYINKLPSKTSTPKNSNSDLFRAKDIPLPGSAPLSRHGSTTLNGVKEEGELEKREELGSKDIIYSSVGQGDDDGPLVYTNPHNASTTGKLSKGASTGKLDRTGSGSRDLGTSNQLDKSGVKSLSKPNVKATSSERLSSNPNLKSPSSRSLKSSQKDLSEKGEINTKSASKTTIGSMEIIRSTVEKEAEENHSAVPASQPLGSHVVENIFVPEIKPIEHNAVPSSSVEQSHTPDTVNSDSETAHVIPKPKRNVLELNDSTVGRSRSVRSSISRKPMKGIQEKENEEQAAT